MWDWQYFFFRSFFYIGLFSLFACLICCVITRTFQYLKQKSENNQQINNLKKKHKKKYKSEYAISEGIISGGSTQSLLTKLEIPNQHSCKKDETHFEMNSSTKNSVKGSFMNTPDEKHFKYSDSTVLHEGGKYEYTSENETDQCNVLLHSQDESNSFQKKLISPKLNRSKKNIQSKCRETQQKVLYIENSKPKQRKCDKKSYIIQNKARQDRSIGNSNRDYISLDVDSTEMVDEINNRKVQLCDKEFRIPSLNSELRLNTRKKDNEQMYQSDEKSPSVKAQKTFEDEHTKCSMMPHSTCITNTSEASRKDNETEYASSTCDSTSKEDDFWKSLNSETVNQKRNKRVQTEAPRVEQDNAQLLLQNYANVTNDCSKQKYQEAISHIQRKQDVIKQVQDTIAQKNTLSNTENQCPKPNLNKKTCLPIESPQNDIMEHPLEVRSFSTQTQNDVRNIENRICRNGQIFLPSAYYPEEDIKINKIKPMTSYSGPRAIQTELHYPCYEYLQPNHTQQLTESTEDLHYCGKCHCRQNFTCEKIYITYNRDDDLQNKNNNVCKQIMSINHSENKHFNPYDDKGQREIQQMHSEQGKFKQKSPEIEKIIYHKNEHIQPQKESKKLLNCAPSKKVLVTSHQYNQTDSSTKKFYNRPISWNDENEFYDRNIDMQGEDNFMQPSLNTNYKNNRSKMCEIIETDVKGVQTSEESAFISQNHANKYIPKEKAIKPNSNMENDAQKILETRNAEKNHIKANIERRVRKMYYQIDQNVHETNKNVISQLKKHLQMTGKWQPGST